MAEALAVAGAALSATSLTIQFVDECIKGYRFLSEASSMPDSHRYLHVRLQMEQQQFLSFAEEAGLLFADNDISEVFKGDLALLHSILYEIQMLFQRFQDANVKYVDTTASPQPEPQCSLMEAICCTKNSVESLGKPTDPTAKEKAVSRGLAASIMDRTRRGTRKFRTIVVEPKRLVWAALDHSSFEELISELNALNTFLISLLDQSSARRVSRAIDASYREILQLHNDMSGLHAIMQALVREGRDTRACNCLTLADSRNFSKPETILKESRLNAQRSLQLAQLTDIKLRRLSFEKPEDHEEHVETSALDVKLEINLSIDIPQTSGLSESADVRDIIQWKHHRVWVESIECHSSSSREQSSTLAPKMRLRVNLLAKLLKEGHLEDFSTPHCHGYVNLRKQGPHPWYGLVFGLPQQSQPTTAIFNLRQFLELEKMPSLSARISLALKLSQSVGRFHAVDWLHKGLRSENILFFGVDIRSSNLQRPFITGFGLSRPGDKGDLTEAPTFDPCKDIYRHPMVQAGENSTVYQKSYDLYSLGVLLLEIACWKPIECILGFEDLSNLTDNDLRGVRSRLLERKPSESADEESDCLLARPTSFQSQYLQKAATYCGDSYRSIVELLLRADEVCKPSYPGETRRSQEWRLRMMFDEGILQPLEKLADALQDAYLIDGRQKD